MEDFKAAKKKFKTAFTEILKDTNNLIIDEAALPAYAHKNPFIDYLFWKRLEVAFKFIHKNGRYKKVLDFGCGSGVLSYVMAHHGYEVTGCDLEFSPLRLVQRKIDFPSSIHFIEGDIRTQNLPDHSFDVIFALDVLEHIDNTGDYIQLFKKILTPHGVVVVSGPTENILYKIGRKFAGHRFTGDYHVKDISTIKQEFLPHMKVKPIKKLFFPIVFFELFAAINDAPTSKTKRH